MSAFTIAGYRTLLQEALRQGYAISGFAAADSTRAPAMILRHDVDFSLDYALDMARVENELGIRATYFIMTTNEYYNPLSEPGRQMIAEIAALGHEVGLHWDSRFLPDTNRREFFAAQLALLSAAAGTPIRAASQHVPTDSPAFDITPHIEINAYAPHYREHYNYVSDSSMAWRNVTPGELIAQRKNIHFLAHPIWWMAEGRTPDEKIAHMIARTTGTIQQHASEYLTYMKSVLAERTRYDTYFEQTQRKRV